MQSRNSREKNADKEAIKLLIELERSIPPNLVNPDYDRTIIRARMIVKKIFGGNSDYLRTLDEIKHIHETQYLSKEMFVAIKDIGSMLRAQIRNACKKPVQVFWIAADGKRVPNGKIEPGKDSIIGTSLRHRFVIVDDGKEMEVVSQVPVQTFRVGGVPDFYTRVIHAQGYPICGSAKVSPYALKEAAYLADLMLAKRPDVREAMIASGSRLCILAHDEFTTDQQKLILKIKNFKGKKIVGKISAKNTDMDLRFNQIKFADGSLDGPFGRAISIEIPKPGEICLIIGKNLIADGKLTEKFSVTLQQ